MQVGPVSWHLISLIKLWHIKNNSHFISSLGYNGVLMPHRGGGQFKNFFFFNFAFQ